MSGHALADISVLDQFAAAPFPPGMPSDRRVLFSPVDRVEDALAFLLGSAETSLNLCMYAFTSPRMVQAVTEAANNGVKVCLTLDSSQFKDDGEKVKLASILSEAGVDYTIGTSEKGAIMHLKAGVIDGTVVFSGSTNWSDSGAEMQDNELAVQIAPAMAAVYAARFSAVHAYQKEHPA